MQPSVPKLSPERAPKPLIRDARAGLAADTLKSQHRTARLRLKRAGADVVIQTETLQQRLQPKDKYAAVTLLQDGTRQAVNMDAVRTQRLRLYAIEQAAFDGACSERLLNAEREMPAKIKGDAASVRRRCERIGKRAIDPKRQRGLAAETIERLQCRSIRPACVRAGAAEESGCGKTRVRKPRQRRVFVERISCGGFARSAYIQRNDLASPPRPYPDTAMICQLEGGVCVPRRRRKRAPAMETDKPASRR